MTVFYSRNVLKCLTVDKYDILGDGECRTLEPFRTILTDNIRYLKDIYNIRQQNLHPTAAVDQPTRTK